MPGSSEYDKGTASPVVAVREGTEALFDGTATLTVDGVVVLIPTPSVDPRDPLNLPWWRKVFLLIILTTYAVSGLALVTSLGALIVYMQEDYIAAGVTPQQLSNLFTYPNLFLGIGNIVSMPLAVSIGRRPVILGSTVMLFVSCVICATNTGYHSHLAGRMVAAFSAAQCQALVLLIIQDVFFLHQRARVIQCYSSAEITFNSALVIAASYMADSVGWRSAYWLFGALSCLSMVFTFLFVPETFYERPIQAYMGNTPMDPSSQALETSTTTKPYHLPESAVEELHRSSSSSQCLTTADGRPLDLETFQPRTWKSDLTILTHKVRPSEFLRCLRQIGIVFLFPHVLWVAINNGIFQGIDVSIMMTYANVLTNPPYNWGNTTVSLIQLGQIAVAAMCLPLIGTMGDWFIRFVARRNKGVHEPEYRLVTMILPLVMATILTVIYGYAIAEPGRFHWFAIVLTVNAYLFILLSASTAGTTYVIDSHPKDAGAMLVVLPVTRGLVGFGVSFHTSDYLSSIGPVATFGIYAGISAVIGVLGVLLFWKGKKLRHFCAQYAS
ncbi:major facilitator superfamily domain-containing protein [Plectosphaerella plurivora]|uniref:Major facilitator superfamily domain-containing protein n=1 Tax=Plectosphaerella plurivora TaxID=936078 RepID=A0A9P8VH32_9PEZI|nr:major facilitator superfamily domain-containing protein [Plectosphaerella plurivora]